MEEIVKLVAAKTGLSPESARMAVDLVITEIKAKMGGPLGAQLGAYLQNILDDKASEKPLGLIAKGLGGLFGGKK